MESQSVNTLLTWLKSAPRTLGWGAILAYDRSKTNVMLEQEYIDRFVEGATTCRRLRSTFRPASDKVSIFMTTP